MRFAGGGPWPLRTPNLTLWIVVGLAFALLLSALYVPWAVSVLRFAPLPAHELAAAGSLGLVSVLWSEGIKLARRMAGDGASSSTNDGSATPASTNL